MALNEFERKRIERLVGAFMEGRRPPVELRPKVDLGFRVRGQSVEIFEIRPQWDKPEVILEHSVAKATFRRSKTHWRVFWQRSDLKWHSYEPVPVVETIEAFLALVDEDEYGCFWG